MQSETEITRVRVQNITVEQDYQGQRLDNYLMRLLKGVPKTRIYRIIRKGEVRVNKGRIRADYKLTTGDIIRVPPIRLANAADDINPSESLIQRLEASILFEDASLIVINKPSGLAVHGGSGLNMGLIEAMRTMRPTCKILDLVHRLDRDTSGCVMIAKKRSTLRHLHECLRQRQVTKVYQALVIGRWRKKVTQIDVALKKNIRMSGERVVKVDPDGKASNTRFQLLHAFSECSLVEARPVTGRTHQIRVHCQFAGNSILGDKKYASDVAEELARKLKLKRLFLHASQLVIPMLDQSNLEVVAPLAPELATILAKLNR